MKSLYIIILFLGCIVFCSCKAKPMIVNPHLEDKIESLKKEKTDMMVQINTLEHIVETKNSELYTQKHVPKYSLVEKSIFHGYGRMLKDAEMKPQPSTSYDCGWLLSQGETVYILDEFICEDESHWLLVKSYNLKMYGYIRTDEIEMVDIASYMEESQWDIYGIKIGKSLNSAIFILGNSYSKIEASEYQYDETALFDNNGDQIEINYNPISKVIEKITTTSQEHKVSGLIGVGNNVYDSAKMLTDKFVDNKQNNYILIEDCSKYYILLYYDKNFDITVISYRTYEIDA